MATSNWKKFRLLLWKNWLLQMRQVYMTLAEILFPVVLSVVLIIIRTTIKEPTTFADPTYFPSFDIDSLPYFDSDDQPNALFYAPSDPVTDAIIEQTKKHLPGMQFHNFTVKIFGFVWCF